MSDFVSILATVDQPDCASSSGSSGSLSGLRPGTARGDLVVVALVFGPQLIAAGLVRVTAAVTAKEWLHGRARFGRSRSAKP